MENLIVILMLLTFQTKDTMLASGCIKLKINRGCQESTRAKKWKNFLQTLYFSIFFPVRASTERTH